MARKRTQQRSFLSRLGEMLFGGGRASTAKSRRPLRLESLENRQYMAADLGSITGHMFQDSNNNNTYDAAEVGVAGLQVQLYRDTGNGTYGSNDTLVTTTTTDATGNYHFDNLDFGTYFVRRPAQTASSGEFAGKKFSAGVSGAIHPTALKTVIDDYTSPASQTAAVDTTADNIPGTSIASNIPTAHTLGGEREIITNFTGDVTGPGILMSARVATINVAGTPTGMLLFDATSSAKGVYTLVYDGSDGVASTTPNTTNGLGNLDLTAGHADQFRVQLNSLDLPGATLRVTVYTDATHFSTASLPLLARVMDGVASPGGQTEYAFRFDGTGNGGFAAAPGAIGNADFKHVKAITLSVDAQNNDIDAQIKSFAAYGPATETVDLPIDEADVSLVKAVSNPTPNIGETVNYTITVSNATNLPGGRASVQATGIQVTDVLLIDALNKNRLTYVSDNSAGKFNAATGIWDVGVLNPGQSKSIVIAMRVNQSALPSVLNTATVTKLDQPDPDTDDWTDSKTITPKYVDIAVAKTVDNARPNENDPLSFTVTVANNGTAAATNVKIADALSGNTASFQFVSSDPAIGTTYNSATGLWVIPTLNAGQSVQLVVHGKVIECTSFTNTASLQSIGNGIDINTNNNRSAVVVVPQQVDIGITKTIVANGGLPANSTPNKSNPNVAFLITASNTGPDNASGLVVLDSLPNGLVFVSADPSYNATTGDWNVGSLATGTTRTLLVVARLANGNVPTTIQNRASVLHVDQCDEDSANDSSTVTINPQLIDLSVTKTVSNATPTVGDNVTWTMTVTNSGPNAATGVSLKDALPSGVTYVTSNTAFGSYNAATGIWTIGSLAVNQTISLSVVSTVNVASTQTNTIEVYAADQTDIDSTPNNGAIEDDLASASITPKPRLIDLSVTKTVSNATPTVGDNVTWTMTVTNSGYNAATGVSLKDVLPIGVTYVTSSTAVGSYNAANGIWTVGSLAVNQTISLSVVSTVNVASTQTNTIEVYTADQTDVDSTPNNGAIEDDLASASITPKPKQIDLSVTKKVNNVTPTVGDTVLWTMTVTNSGPYAATGVTLKDFMPNGVSFVYASTLKIGYIPATNVWVVGNLAVNETATLVLATKVNVASPQTNTIEVFTADQPDIDSIPNNGANEDDRASASIAPSDPVIDLSVTKTVNKQTPKLGDTITYTIGVTNSGPNVATGVSLHDYLPAALAFVSSSAGQGSYNATTGIWTVGTVGVNQTITLSITTTIIATGVIDNITEVHSADQRDIDSTPNNGLKEDDLAEVLIVAPTTEGNPDPPPVFSKKLFLAH